MAALAAVLRIILFGSAKQANAASPTAGGWLWADAAAHILWANGTDKILLENP